ncbi:30S ribosome-binding factor RbfA [Candidatus Acetothermia bacterium]|nr:MAG: 30S ribosome-binding factor RbfA [Candidatus Acetothermia bacterium]
MRGERSRRRLSAEIQRILAEVLEFEVKDPTLREAAPTVVEVRLTQDAQRATVYVYVAGGEGTRQAALAALNHDKGFLRTQLARRLHVRRVPELSFQLDDTLDRALRLERLFDAPPS